MRFGITARRHCKLRGTSICGSYLRAAAGSMPGDAQTPRAIHPLQAFVMLGVRGRLPTVECNTGMSR